MNLKTLLGALLAATAATTASACIYAHTYMSTCAISEDVMYIKVYWDSRQVCMGSLRKDDASGSKTFVFTEGNGCDRGFRVEVSDSGRKMRYWGSDGFKTDLSAQSSDANRDICFSAGEDGAIMGHEYEACLSDGGVNCATAFDCKLCSFKKGCLAGMGVPK